MTTPLRCSLDQRSARFPPPTTWHATSSGSVGSVVSIDGRIEVICNGRSGTGSLVRLVQRRDRLHRQDPQDQGEARWPPLRVVLVRHPIDRMVSAFFDMCIDPMQSLWSPLAGSPRSDTDDISDRFDAFIDAAAERLSRPLSDCDARLRPQVATIEGVQLDHIGRQERFEDAVRTIEQMASIRLLPEDPWCHVQLNRSGARASGFRPTAPQRRKVRCLYESDFIAWGYDDGDSGRPARRCHVVRSADGGAGIAAH